MTILFLILSFLVIYTYLGYGFIIWVINKLTPKKQIKFKDQMPEVTVVIAAFNEEDYIKEKIENTLVQDYPSDKLHILVVADGSSDNTANYAKSFENVTVLHRPERMGKTAALNRAMVQIETPLVFFTDANAMLNTEAISNMVKQFNNPKVGCVAGEKRVLTDGKFGAVGGGEGLYWKYESFLKKQDYLFETAVGAAGEIFGVRTHLYQTQPNNTILDDFMISMQIAEKGYKIAYEPNAYALEAPSANIKEELKRKIRISSGGLQSILRLLPLLNILVYGKLSFQYISHRVLRWTLTPFALPILLVLNFYLAMDGNLFYSTIFIAQLAFYIAALAGGYYASKNKKVKVLFIPFYFLFMNYSVFPAMIRLFKGSASAVWERSERATLTTV